MTDLLTAAQMRAVEQAAMAAGAVTGESLMERAGRGVVDAILAWRPALATGAHRAHVLCGPGNNGGDGYVIARRLKALGWDVCVFALAPAATPDAHSMAALWAGKCEGDVRALTRDTLSAAAPPDLSIDAIFGTGLTRGPTGILAEALGALADPASGAYVPAALRVAVDAPSGLCLDSGRVLAGRGTLPRAGLTVSFETPKPGHFLADGPGMCGALAVVDLGLAAWRAALSPAPVRLIDQAAWGGTAPAIPLDFTKGQGHKYAHGHVLVVSGGMGRSGAARLAARAALRIGAGAVTVAAPGSAMMECATQLTAIMLRKCQDASALRALIDDSKITALVIGPGLGLGPEQAALVAGVLDSGVRCVLDADALTHLSQDAGLRERLHGACLLTPHMGEFRRLWPDLADRLEADVDATTGPATSKVEVTREAARHSGATVLLKGPDTVIAAPDGTAVIHAAVYDRAVPWLATAGAGDVLAGLAAGLWAREADATPLEAAAGAAWLHAEAARAFGPGLIAEDLPEMLPQVLRGTTASGAV